MNSCFTCLNCGRVNPVKGHSYTNKYCNNSCQQQHKSRLLVNEWRENQSTTAWRQVPDYVRRYLIEQRGASCELCWNDQHAGKPIPLVVDHRDNNTHNNEEKNLIVICPNCRAQR